MFNLLFLRNFKAKKKSGSKANLSVISVAFIVAVSWKKSLTTTFSDFFFHLTQLVSLLL